MHPPVITEQTATDVDSARDLLTASYSEGRVRVEEPDDFVFAQRRQDLGEVRLDELRYSFRTSYEMSPMGHVLILRARDGEFQFADGGGGRREFGPGDVFLCAQPDEGYRAISRTRRAQAVGLDLTLLAEVSEEPATDLVRRFRRDALAPEQARHWRRTVDYLTDTLAGNDAAAASPLVLGAAGRMLAAATISAFTAEPEPASALRPEAATSTVRRAVAFMEANPDLDLGVVDVARACHISVRALQLAFRRQLDTTPMAYLRRVRLDRVRADLRTADPAQGVTVTQIAARWGFADPSRFSAHYRRVFGEPPRDTLRN